MTINSLLCRRLAAAAIAASVIVAGTLGGATARPSPRAARPAPLWAVRNQFAWAVVPYDARRRSPAERAAMLRELGLTKFGYDGGPAYASTYDDELESLRRAGIELVAWWFPFEADDPFAEKVLQTLQRHGARPRLYVMLRPLGYPKTRAEWAPYVPAGFVMPMTPQETAALSPEGRRTAEAARAAFYRSDMPQGASAQAERVRREALRVAALARLAGRYDCRVALYNNAGWSALPANQLAILHRLGRMGIKDVGIAYAFQHAADELHDDTANFSQVWRSIRKHTVAIVLTAVGTNPLAPPGEGRHEVAMMRVIQSSGWNGPVGLLGERRADTEVTLRAYQAGVIRAAAQISDQGS